MDNFVYEYTTKVLFGKGAAKEHLGKALSAYGPNVMLAYGSGSVRKNGVYDEMMEILDRAGKTVTEFRGIMPNPTYAKVQEGAALAREKHIDFILAVGGGSVIDCCKVIAAQAVLDEDIWDMELVQRRFPTLPPIPMGAVVTASGTGAEMNGGAVITHEEKKVKTGIFAAAPRFAVLDPDYTARSNLMWDSAMAENGILKCGRGTDFQAHQIEHQLGAYADCNHGQGLAVIHPALYRVMCEKAPEKFARFAANVWEIPSQGKTEQELAAAGVDALEEFIQECGLPARLSELSMRVDAPKLLTSGMLKEIADSSSLIGTGYAPVSHEEIFQILKECL